MAFSSNLSIITGSPGTGKTTVLKAIIEVYKALYPKEKIKLAAPTGRASRRMAESTGETDASTLHSMLGLQNEDGYFKKDKEFEPIGAGLIIVDESSMIDMWLARQFFMRIGNNTKIVLCRRPRSAAKRGCGRCVPSAYKQRAYSRYSACKIFRQKDGSRIALNAMGYK